MSFFHTLIFFGQIPICIFFQAIKPPLFGSLSCANQGESAVVRSTETICGAHSLDTIIIPFSIYDNDIVVKIKQPPAIRADSLVIFLNKVGTAFGIAAARQLHHLGPLVKATELVALGGIIIVAVAFNLGIIVLVVFARHHFTDIQVFSHHSHRSNLTHSICTRYCYIVITTAITRIRKSFVSILTYTPSTSQCLGVVKRHILAAAQHRRRTRFRAR